MSSQNNMKELTAENNSNGEKSPGLNMKNEPSFGRYFKGPFDVRSISLTGIFVILLFYTLDQGKTFFLPIFLALLLHFLLRPVVRDLASLHIPEAIGSFLVLFSLLAVTIYAVVQLAEPASEWMAKAPVSLRKAERKIRHLREPMEKVSQAAEEVEKMTTINGNEKKQQVAVKEFTLTDNLLSGTTSFIASFVIMFILLYFLLASGDFFMRKLVKILPTLNKKRRAVDIARKTERHISRYLFTVTLINTGLGLVTGFSLYLIGMPNAVLWGVMAGLLNFIPYLGAITGVTIVSIVALLSFDTMGQALLAPVTYLLLTSLEGYLITPMILGRSFTLNPVFIFVSLIFWTWIWGVPGALLAVPLLAVFKIVCDNIKPLYPIGEFLG